MRLILATAGAALALSASAQAAYAPKLQLSISPTTQNAAPAVTSVITQQPGETASKTVVVTFPKGFQPNFGATAGSCSQAQENAKACPPDSQIGAAQATASVLGLPEQFSGTVNFGGPITASSFRIVVFLHNDTLGDQKVDGTAELLPSGGARTTFDNLPNTLTTTFKLTLDGGGRSLLRNPATCGDFDVVASFTSQNGDKASADRHVTIDGCRPTPLAVTGVSLSRARVSIDVSAPARVQVTIKRGRKRITGGTLALAQAGTAKLRFPRLRPGRYVVAVVATAADGRTVRLRATRTVR